MSNEQLIILLVSILVPMLGGFAWIIRRFDKIDQKFDKIQETITSIDKRISRMEGAFEERSRNEPKIYLVKGENTIERVKGD